LHGIPEDQSAARCTFTDLDQCAAAAYHVLLNDIPVKRMELVDAASIKQVNAFGDYHFPVEHSLFFEFAGSENTALTEAETTKKLMYAWDCANWEVAETENDNTERRKAPHAAAPCFRAQQATTLCATA